MPFLYNLKALRLGKGASPMRGASPKQRSARLGEPEAPNLPVSATL